MIIVFLIFNITNLPVEKIGERITAQSGIVGEVNLVILRQTFDFTRLNAKNQGGLRLGKSRRFRPAILANNELFLCIAPHSDNRQAMCFNRNFGSPYFHFVHSLSHANAGFDTGTNVGNSIYALLLVSQRV